MPASPDTRKPPVTRFAPSPTGMLHIGGARTALFSWAYARGRGGKFLLRIEDTDQARSTPEATRRIVEDLAWLGLDWDEGPDADAVAAGGDPYENTIGDHGPYFQSQRLPTYADAVATLLESGRAYRCYKTPEQLTAERDAARAAGKPYKYDRGESTSLSDAQIAEYEAEGRPFVIRFRVPDEDVVVHDEVLGDVVTAAAELEDFVIQKSDDFPTFHLAVVCDDEAMNVTHVIRGQEHLNNTPRHVALQDALGFRRPTYAHIPLIFNADGSKMSKRDKAKAARARRRYAPARGPARAAPRGGPAALAGLYRRRQRRPRRRHRDGGDARRDAARDRRRRLPTQRIPPAGAV